MWHKTTFIYSLSLKHRVNVNVILRHQDEAAWSFYSHYSKTGFLFGNHKMCKCLFGSKISGHWVSVNSKGNKIKFNKTCDHRQTPRSVQWPRQFLHQQGFTFLIFIVDWQFLTLACNIHIWHEQCFLSETAVKQCYLRHVNSWSFRKLLHLWTSGSLFFSDVTLINRLPLEVCKLNDSC